MLADEEIFTSSGVTMLGSGTMTEVMTLVLATVHLSAILFVGVTGGEKETATVAVSGSQNMSVRISSFQTGLTGVDLPSSSFSSLETSGTLASTPIPPFGHGPSVLRYRHSAKHPRGPHFEENVVNVVVREFQNVHLDCRVGLIEDKLVSWVRRKTDELELLTLGTYNHSSDVRFSSDFWYPNNWRLGIRNASRADSGTYLCQISTHPPKVLEVFLTVEAPEVFVISSRGERVQDVYYKEGSTLQLICEVSNLKSRFVNWYHNADLLNHDVTRGGVSIKTVIVGDSAKSTLNLARITRRDIGTYRCSAPPQNATVTVHILNGENPAELYHNGGNRYSLGILLFCILQLRWSSSGITALVI